jgi:hypothetical protein
MWNSIVQGKQDVFLASRGVVVVGALMQVTGMAGAVPVRNPLQLDFVKTNLRFALRLHGYLEIGLVIWPKVDLKLTNASHP